MDSYKCSCVILDSRSLAQAMGGAGLEAELAVVWGCYVLVGIISGRETWPLYGAERWPRNRGFLCTILRAMHSGPRSVSAIGRVAAYQGWSLRGVPLYWYIVSIYVKLI